MLDPDELPDRELTAPQEAPLADVTCEYCGMDGDCQCDDPPPHNSCTRCNAGRDGTEGGPTRWAGDISAAHRGDLRG